VAKKTFSFAGGEPPEAFLDRTPIILARASTAKQRESLAAQVEDMRARVRALRFRKQPIIIEEQTSGKKADLRTLRALKDIVTNPKRGQKFVVFVRDTARFARSTRQATIAVDDVLLKNDVPLIPFDLNQAVGPEGTVSRMLFEINVAVSTGGKASEYTAKQQRQQQREEEGVPSGVPQDLYPQLFKNGMTVHRQVWSLRDAFRGGVVSRNGGAKSVGLLPQKFGQLIARMEEIEDMGGPEKVEEFLNVIDVIVDLERRGRGVAEHNRARKPARSRTPRSVAMHRATVGYLQDPFRYPNPVNPGNVMVARPDSRDRALGTVMDAFDNPALYIPDKR